MGIVGRWIDSLPEDRMRDHIIEHPDPTFDGWTFYDAERDCGCLTGCVALAEGEERSWYGVTRWLWEQLPHTFPEDPTEHLTVPVYLQFPLLADRFGPERMWRLVKARAAKANRVVLPEQVAELEPTR